MYINNLKIYLNFKNYKYYFNYLKNKAKYISKTKYIANIF